MRWKELLGAESPALLALDAKTAASCTVLCPGCHTPSQLLPPAEASTPSLPLLSSVKAQIPELREACTKFCRHKLSAAALFDKIESTFKDQRDEILARLLPLVHDTERRAALYLHWRHVQPFTYTACCNSAVCYLCHTAGHHEDCPECHLQLVKGDGCDSITCFCGASFNWADRLRACKLAQHKDVFRRVLFFLRARVQKHKYTIFVVSQIPSYVLQQRLLFITYNFFCPIWNSFRRSLLVLVHRRRLTRAATPSVATQCQM
ncbi:hypothetical protein ACHHYP_01758 [Achlya hypogyna]|uniref:Uncharacterized protein n=1 Tax=Achlya hypogyna TaxID=1202772 RepID=A0A1V9ZT64_ACHHY|nr:hypothetical protein ACHHYP_01758 [Achlya hypogyna]